VSYWQPGPTNARRRTPGGGSDSAGAVLEAHQAGRFRRRARHVDHTDQDDVAWRDLVDGGDDVVGEHRVVALGQ
jgi:hypothetical protein